VSAITKAAVSLDDKSITKAAVSLDDKYALERGRVFLTGTQALVRLPIAQRQRDRAAGLNTGGFISGYRGSPLGMYDQALWRARKFLEANDIHFVPGVNEDLAATAVWGSQQLHLTPGARVDAVTGIWYGKGPGVDRSLDVLKHANAAGVHPNGGVLAILGDDHGAQSSTLAHSSEQVLIAAMIPVINPASVREYIDFGLMGIALSRYTGCWVGFKAVTETVEGSATVDVDPLSLRINVPTDFEPPPGGFAIRWPDKPLEMELRLHGPKMQAVAAFARANRFDWPVWGTPRARVAIITTGKAYGDVREALELLGIDERRAASLRISLYKVGLIWPLEDKALTAFCADAEEVVVVEEKAGVVEDQLVKALYNQPRRPTMVVGKRDEAGQVLFPTEGVLEPLRVAIALGRRLASRFDDPELKRAVEGVVERVKSPAVQPSSMTRVPFFCAGCPHNTSTRLPDGSRGLSGIGCHGLAGTVPERRTALHTHMGGEGATWIGQAPFNNAQHIFQNLGDGTYYHSGLLAIRAARAAKINITYKILYNDAVAMTGGQPLDGPLSVQDITWQVAAEGARKIFVVTDEPDKYPSDAKFAPGVVVRHREHLDEIQRELRETPGLTVLVYDQVCAAEKRRRRKRNLYPDPPRRIFINDRVCEGCGDCSEKSNCVAVKPLETEFGRKRQIDQSDCNKDFSCVNGFCPSFVTVHGAKVRKAARVQTAVLSDPFRDLPMPTTPEVSEPFQILVTGIGGTGVVTIGALLGMAAHVDGKASTVLDFTGLAQKNGSVMSHIRIARTPEELHAVRIAPGKTDTLIACDMLVAAGAPALALMDRSRTRAVINDRVQPTSDFVRNTLIDFGEAGMRRALEAAVGSEAKFIDATGIAVALMGDSIATNLFLLGYAWQKGLLPVSFAALEQAIELNGIAVEANKRTFAWGRLAAHDMSAVKARVAGLGEKEESQQAPTLEALIKRRTDDLTRYQNAAFASRYETRVRQAAAAEARLGGASGFALAVARNLYKVMAYKDEYEVARLYTDGDFKRKLEAQFEDGYKLQFHLAAPLIARRDPQSGELRKSSFGEWVQPLFGMLARGKVLRGTWADPFGYTHERQVERSLILEYEALVDRVTQQLTTGNHVQAVALVDWPENIRGYGHVKQRQLKAARARLAELLEAFESSRTRQEVTG
jgi:indolepyruvate ferredoxin oxidoreductase